MAFCSIEPWIKLKLDPGWSCGGMRAGVTDRRFNEIWCSAVAVKSAFEWVGQSPHRTMSKPNSNPKAQIYYRHMCKCALTFNVFLKYLVVAILKIWSIFILNTTPLFYNVGDWTFLTESRVRLVPRSWQVAGNSRVE